MCFSCVCFSRDGSCLFPFPLSVGVGCDLYLWHFLGFFFFTFVLILYLKLVMKDAKLLIEAETELHSLNHFKTRSVIEKRIKTTKNCK